MAVIMIMYYLRIREEHKKYSYAKTILDDIMISFKADIDSNNIKIEKIKKNNDLTLDNITNSIINIRTRLSEIDGRLNQLTESSTSIFKDNDFQKNSFKNLMSKEKNLNNRYNNNEYVQETEISSKTRKEPPISIQKEKALYSLTETELIILRLLLDMGETTAPIIRHKINLTREHTSRLMKRLYSQGYIERRTEKMPYKYRLKEEMIGILRPQTHNG